jgi:hypothetical protein
VAHAGHRRVAYCSGLSDSSLCVAMPPSGRRATMSVKVPPRSIQNCQRAGWVGVSDIGSGIKI